MESPIIFGQTPVVKLFYSEERERTPPPITFASGIDVVIEPCDVDGCGCPNRGTRATKMMVRGCENALFIPAIKGGTFRAYPTQWTSDSNVVWFHLEGDDNHHSLTQFELRSTHSEVVPAKDLTQFRLYLVRGLSEMAFFRVVLVKLADNNSEAYFIDFGTTSYVHNEDLFETPNGMVKSLAPSAVPITLIWGDVGERKLEYRSESDEKRVKMTLKIIQQSEYEIVAEVIPTDPKVEEIKKQMSTMDVYEDYLKLY